MYAHMWSLSLGSIQYLYMESSLIFGTILSLASQMCAIQTAHENIMLAYARSYMLDIWPIFQCDLKVRWCLFFWLYSAWDLVDSLSTYNFGTLDSFTPFTNRRVFNKLTYRKNMTQIERENHWNCRWLILACTTFVFAQKVYLHIQINCRTLVIREGANVNCDVARLRQVDS